MTSTKLQNAANLATVIAMIITAVAFGYGIYQFKQTLNFQKETLEEERNAKAVELFIKYNEMMEEPRSGTGAVDDESQFWRENRAISIAESIFNLRKTDPGWKATVNWMLSNHISHLKRTRLNCPTYDADFVKLANEQTKEDLCLPQHP